MKFRALIGLACTVVFSATTHAGTIDDQVKEIEARTTAEIDELIDATGEISESQQQKATGNVRKGITAHDQEDYEKALRSYGRAIELWPTFAFAYYERAYTYSTLGDQIKGLEDACRAALIDPKLEQAHILKASLLDDLGLAEQALSAYEHLLDVQPESYYGQLNYAITLSRLSRIDEAEAAFLAAREIQPEHPSVYLHLSLIANQQGDNYKEQEYLESFVEYGSDDSRLPAVKERLSELTTQTISIDPTSDTMTVDLVAHATRSVWKSTLHKEAFPDATGYAPSFEEEVDVITAVVEAWRELKEEEPEISHGEYEMLTAIVDAGYLEEYVWFVEGRKLSKAGSVSTLSQEQIDQFLSWATEQGYYQPESNTQAQTDENQTRDKPDLPTLVMSLAEACEKNYKLNVSAEIESSDYLSRESRRYRRGLKLTGDHRLGTREEKEILGNPAAVTRAASLVKTLRVFMPEDSEWLQVIKLCRRFGLKLRVDMTPPNPTPIAIDYKRDEIAIDISFNDELSWMVYALSKAVFRSEQDLRNKYGAPSGDEPTVVEELFAWTALLQAYENSLSDPEEETSKGNAYLDQVIEVRQAGNLYGFVLFEVIHKQYGVPLEQLSTEQAEELENYLFGHVFASVNADP